jgi:toxin HigB-1
VPLEWYTASRLERVNDLRFPGRLAARSFVDDVRSRHIPPDLASRLFRKLQMLDDATTDQDLRVPPSNHFEKLRGKLQGFHSIRVNRQWRLIFRWEGHRGEASGVYIDDHSYR